MSPKTLARTAGALNLLLLAGGIVAQAIIADGGWFLVKGVDEVRWREMGRWADGRMGG